MATEDQNTATAGKTVAEMAMPADADIDTKAEPELLEDESPALLVSNEENPAFQPEPSNNNRVKTSDELLTKEKLTRDKAMDNEDEDASESSFIGDIDISSLEQAKAEPAQVEMNDMVLTDNDESDKKPAVSFDAAAKEEASQTPKGDAAASSTFDSDSSNFQTPVAKKDPSHKASASAALSTAGTAVTEASTVASLTPGSANSEWDIRPSNLTDQFSPPASTTSTFNASSDLQGNFGSPALVTSQQKSAVSFSSPPPSTIATATTTALEVASKTASAEDDDDEDTPSPKNEFQQIQLRKSTKIVEKHIKESKLEFAELIANALNMDASSASHNNNISDGGTANLELLRHMDDLQKEVAILNEESEKYDALWEIQRLRQGLLDMFNHTGPMEEHYLLQWILPMHRERDPKTGRLVVNADHVAALNAIATSEEIDMVAGLGMVRSVLQSNFKAINGADCLAAIQEYANFRLGRKSRRAPQNPWELMASIFEKAQNDDSTEDIHQRVCNALVQWVVREILGTTKDNLSSRSCFHAIFLVSSLKLELQRLAPKALEQGPSIELLDDGSVSGKSNVSGKSLVRAPIVEKLLQSNILNDDGSSSGNQPKLKDLDTVPTVDSQIVAVSATKDEAMETAMAVRDNSRKDISAAIDERRTPESDLPPAVQDSHRVIRTILGPNHKQINVSHCFEAIRLYSSLIMEWKEASESNQLSLAAGTPTVEEEKLKMLEVALRPQMIEPPSQIEVMESKIKKVTTKSSKKKQSTSRNVPAPHQLNNQTPKGEEAAPAALVPQSPGKIQAPNGGQKAQKAMQEKVHKSAAAAQIQVKKRTSLLSKLKRIKVSTKSKSKRSLSGDDGESLSVVSTNDYPRHPTKRRSTWKRILGIPEEKATGGAEIIAETSF